MKMFFKIPYTLILGLNLSLISCDKNQKASSEFGKIQQKSISEKPAEEEIKYFLPGGRYEIHVTSLDIYDHHNSKWYLYPEEIKDNMNIIDQAGNVIDLFSLLELIKVDYEMGIFEGEEILVYPKGSIVSVANISKLVDSDEEYDYFFRTDVNIEDYRVVEEIYRIGSGSKRYCTKINLQVISRNYIFDDKLLVRLYDKNKRIISENQMRKNVDLDSFGPGFSTAIQNFDETDVWLRGVLELPSKDQREGLKYRVVRVDENGNQKPFLWSLGKPYNYYYWEEPIDSYVEYSKWYYDGKLGCYIKPFYSPIPNCPPPFLCSQ